MAGNSLLAWLNMVKTAVLTATSAEVALPVTNLADDQGSPSVAWQTLDTVKTATLTITPAARTAVQAFGLFRTNLTAAATVTFNAYTLPGPILIATSGAVTAVNGQAVAALAAPVNADVVTVVISDTTNPDGHLNVPLVFAGPAWKPLTAMAWTSAMGRVETSDTVQTRGGQTYVDLRASARSWDIALDGVRAAEAFGQLDPLDRYVRIGGNALVIPNTAGANIQYESTFGVLKPTASVTFPLGVDSRRSWRGTLTERL